MNAQSIQSPLRTTLLALRTSSVVTTCLLVAAYVLIWMMQYTPAGLNGDAHLYAFQAMARLHPHLQADIYLAHGSQDKYTLFTSVYAWMIDSIGLVNSQAVIVIFSHALSAYAVWRIARHLTNSNLAWLVTGVVMVVPGFYGSSWVFQYSEYMVTARMPTEGLVLLSVALGLERRLVAAWILSALALVTHPIMTLPGVVLLALSTFTPIFLRTAWITGTAIVLVAIIVSVAAPIGPLTVLDPEWLALVQQRSRFLFLSLWRGQDWDWCLLTFLTLFYVWSTTSDIQQRSMAKNAAQTGAIGMALTAIASYIVPVQLFLMGQPWRWMWITTLLALALLTIKTIETLRNGNHLERACILALGAAWVLPVVWANPPSFIAAPIALGALAISRYQSVIPVEYKKYAIILGYCVLLASLVSVIASTGALWQLEVPTNATDMSLARIVDMMSLSIPAVALAYAAWIAAHARNVLSQLILAAVTVAGLTVFVPYTEKKMQHSPLVRAAPSFADWRAVIGTDQEVMWLENAAGVWFLLDRRGYLSISQAAGIVFSRDTAMRIKSRSLNVHVLKPHAGLNTPREASVQPPAILTTEILRRICADPDLGFVVSDVTLPIPHLTHEAKDFYRKQKLYNCNSVR